jgi:hypothetical protein
MEATLELLGGTPKQFADLVRLVRCAVGGRARDRRQARIGRPPLDQAA